MEISAEDKAILAHVVIDPDAWVDHALATVGEWAVTAKIERWRPIYLIEKDKPDYRNRAEREALAEIAELPPTQEQLDGERIQRRMR